MGRKINIRPTTSVYSTFKNISYHPWTAIAEFVDNSTQSYFDNKDRLIQTKYWNGLDIQVIFRTESGKPVELIVKDNAFGMDFHDFQRAIVLDSKPISVSRGEFGMGLKTAACWFGSNWSVETTALGSNVKYFAQVDVNALRVYKNEEIEVIEETCNQKEHFTIIRIWNLNRGIMGRQVQKVKNQLTGMYRNDLQSGEINISYNGEPLSYTEPKYMVEELGNGSKKTWKQPIKIDLPYNGTNLLVNGFVALLETGSTSDAGFALMRKGRVIVGGSDKNYRPEEIFEKSNSYVYQRLYGEINLDDWPVTQTKDGFDWLNGLEDSLIDSLKLECAEFIKKAKEYRKNKPGVIDPRFDSILDDLGKKGVLEDVVIKQPVEASAVPNQSDIVEQQPDAHSRLLQEEESTVPSNSGLSARNSSQSFSFGWNNIKYDLEMITLRDNPTCKWLSINERDSVNNSYSIEWNLSHPFFRPFTEEDSTMEALKGLIFALVLSELDAMKTSPGRKIDTDMIRNSMNELLKQLP